MSLFRKCPVENPCAAETFEEAFRKNAARLSHERRESADLYREMKEEGDPHEETVNPEFWRGCQEANSQAQKIYKEELERLNLRVVERLSESARSFDAAQAYEKGFNDVNDTIIEALRKNDPCQVVWW